MSEYLFLSDGMARIPSTLLNRSDESGNTFLFFFCLIHFSFFFFWKQGFIFIYLFILFIYSHVHTLFGSFLYPAPLPPPSPSHSVSGICGHTVVFSAFPPLLEWQLKDCATWALLYLCALFVLVICLEFVLKYFVKYFFSVYCCNPVTFFFQSFNVVYHISIFVS
jgi:hypothetical protein